MRLSYRPPLLRELPALFAEFGDATLYPPEIRPHVADVWAKWLRGGVLMATVIEDQSDLAAVKAVGFGASVFIHPAFAEEIRGSSAPYTRAALVRREREGRVPAALSLEQVRQANRAGELVAFFVNDPLTNPRLNEEELHLVHEKWSESLYEFRGCRLAELLWEVQGQRLVSWSAGCGLHLRQDWKDHWDGSAPADAVRPYLVGLNRREATAAPGSHASFLFVHVAPHFGFTARQQELLRRALQGDTDEDLAHALHLSVPAVKKRWAAVYERISSTSPGWLEKNDDPAGEFRGSEKRRRLLNYLRQHPEELHPANAARD